MNARHRRMIQWCLVYDTVVSGVWYRDVWCMIWWRLKRTTDIWYMWHLVRNGQGCLEYNTVASGVWYSGSWRRKRQYLVYTGIGCKIHHITVSYIKYHCIIHQTPLHDTPQITVSYTKHHCIIHHVRIPHQIRLIEGSTPTHRACLHRAYDASLWAAEITNTMVSYTKHHRTIHQNPLYMHR